MGIDLVGGGADYTINKMWEKRFVFIPQQYDQQQEPGVNDLPSLSFPLPVLEK